MWPIWCVFNLVQVCLFNTELDSGWDLPAETYHNWVTANRRTRGYIG